MIRLDPEAEEIFEVVDPGQGDEFMAVLPWKGAIKEPLNHPPVNKTKPDANFQIDFVYGYKCEDVRMNLFFNASGNPVYMAAALGIIFDPKSREQTYFGGGETKEMTRKQLDTSTMGHSDDITALCMNVERTMVATGQVGLAPPIYVWDSRTAELLHSFKLPKGSRGVSGLGFSKDGRYIAAVDLHNEHKVHCFDV